MQDVYVLIVREQEEDQTQVVDSSPTSTTTQQDSFLSAYVFVCCSLFLVLSTLLFQLYCIQNPLIATVTIIPTSQQVTVSGTMQLGRVLPPLTISQSQTTPATGHGHQQQHRQPDISPFTTVSFKVCPLQQEPFSPEQAEHQYLPTRTQSYQQQSRRVSDK